MTEQEAKQKWCHFSRTVSISENGRQIVGNRNLEPKDRVECKCIGSYCMAWMSGETNGTGYCGLAGRSK